MKRSLAFFGTTALGLLLSGTIAVAAPSGPVPATAGNANANANAGVNDKGVRADANVRVGDQTDNRDRTNQNQAEKQANRTDDHRTNDRDNGRRDSRVSADQWRYTWSGGHWWYWLPSNRWMYYDNSQWIDYDQTGGAIQYHSGYRGDGVDERTARHDGHGSIDANPVDPKTVKPELDRNPLDDHRAPATIKQDAAPMPNAVPPGANTVKENPVKENSPQGNNAGKK